jgi:redox-sensitive bicupin YhaK (pirin superfamily)
MLTLRRSNERGHTNHGWLDSRFSFSFADYYDDKQMGFGPLRVINEDVIAPGQGFGFHPHKDMEIITYIIDGQLQHKDSLGTGSVIKPGEIQKMSAGTGIVHSEFNASESEPCHLLQIWIIPDKRGLEPKYEQESFTLKPNEFKLLGSKNGSGLISIHQNVNLYAFATNEAKKFEFESKKGSSFWIQIVDGKGSINGASVGSGDGLAVSDVPKIEIDTKQEMELLLFEILAA